MVVRIIIFVSFFLIAIGMGFGLLAGNEGSVFAVASADQLSRKFPVESTRMKTEGCHCPAQPFECICSSSFSRPLYKHIIWQQMNTHPPPPIKPVPTGFPKILREGVGYDNVIHAGKSSAPLITKGKSLPYLSGYIQENIMAFSRPNARIRYAFSEHQPRKSQTQPQRDLLIVLHGLSSSANQVVGVGGKDEMKEVDYMKQVSIRYFKKGMDVASFDLPSFTVYTSNMSVVWMMDEVQVFGLWSRAICDAVKHNKWEQSYRRIFVYGLSNGGQTALYLANLCGSKFAQVFVGDVLGAWGESQWNSPVRPNNDLKWGWAGTFLRHDLSDRSLMNNLLHFAKSPLVITKSKTWFDENRHILERRFKVLLKPDSDARINFLFKEINQHVPEFRIVDKIIGGEWNGINGVVLEAP